MEWKHDEAKKNLNLIISLWNSHLKEDKLIPFNTLNNPARSSQLQQDVQLHLLAFLTSKICKNDVTSDMPKT